MPVVETSDLPAEPVGHVVGFFTAACAEAMVEHLAARGASPSSAATSATTPAAMAVTLDEGMRLDAVIGVSDLAAFGALTERRRRGLWAPDDLMIAGFGADEIAGVSAPTITTIDPQTAEIGRQAGALVARPLAEPDAGAGPVRIGIEPLLRHGGSTA